ncbi:GntR family transcriptional regulator [Salipiger sp. PrR003]|uniref:GntR family transcriptional regulator n=1 Tax=Salipiger sp. PrR003 TaxID=2706776 RepID=UPI0013DC23B5|nr:GntR family transcriptional regulator [Salipiger sp. PrR003]NDV49337.1 GntR family transcriptional regulator [Salipiger sp. PrR003]
MNKIAPLYARVKQDLKNRVTSGALAEGDFLPSEPELCAEFGVSRITLRRAVKELCEEGYLLRQQGRGTVVSRRPIAQQLVTLTGFSEAFKAEGAVTHQVLDVKEVRDDKASVLRDAPLLRINRLICVDGRPLTLESLFIDSEALPRVVGPVSQGASFFETLRDTGGPQPLAAERTLAVGFATPAERRHLGVGPTDPVWRIDKTVLAAGDEPIAFSRLVTPTHLITYSLRT